jgi:hypothetical protein
MPVRLFPQMNTRSTRSVSFPSAMVKWEPTHDDAKDT